MSTRPSDAPTTRRHAGGRRPGESTTRELILEVARECFAERGYDATSVRRIAEAAGVDQSLVHHFYGTKENLFLNALEIPFRLPEAIARAVPGDHAGLGERIVRAHIDLWENVVAAPALLVALRSAAVNVKAGVLLREFIADAVRTALADVVTGERADLRAGLICTNLIGLSMARYILLLEPVASASADEVVADLAPALQTYFDPPPR